ncbi:response regulator [Candidatus Saccharibacteria bacterium]|nr:MAG: response regulator [Candidatus Saccharibacteria bacterium]
MNQQYASKNIIIVEDNTALAEIYKTRLELLGYTCYVAYNGITGLYFIQKEMPDLVLLDLMIPDISGGQVLATMRASEWGKNIPVYVISNLNETEAPKDLRDLGISGYSVKAMMTEDTVDKIVNSILRPEVQPVPPSPTDVPPAGSTLADVPFHEAPQV